MMRSFSDGDGQRSVAAAPGEGGMNAPVANPQLDREVFGLRRPMTPMIDRSEKGPEETWTVPVEMALFQADATSLMLVMRARRMGATFRPRAAVWRQGEFLLARIDFLIPVGPEGWCEQVLKLSTRLWESLS